VLKRFVEIGKGKLIPSQQKVADTTLEVPKPERYVNQVYLQAQFYLRDGQIFI